MTPLYEWKCPTPEEQHPAMWGLPDPENSTTTRTPATVILVEPEPEQSWHCFFCGKVLERVRQILG